MEVVTHW